eukprot:Sdes_comp18317_c0_seq1m8037
MNTIELKSQIFTQLIDEKKDYSHLPLKPDHSLRPIWVTPDGFIYLETFSPIYQQAYDFLIAIAEPLCRPKYIHEYRLSPYSLYAAVSVGLETDDIIGVLSRLSKVPLPEGIGEFIRSCTLSYGKVKLVLKHNRYFIESVYADILQTLLKDPLIQEARVEVSKQESLENGLQTGELPKKEAFNAYGDNKKLNQEMVEKRRLVEEKKKKLMLSMDDSASVTGLAKDGQFIEQNHQSHDPISASSPPSNMPQDISDIISKLNQQDEEDEEEAVDDEGGGEEGEEGGTGKRLGRNPKQSRGPATRSNPNPNPTWKQKVHSFEIQQEFVEQIKRHCISLDFPLLEEYDFRNDHHNPNLPMDLKPTTVLRPY